MRDLLIFIIVFGSLPFILRRPHIGILVWFWLGFMNPHRLAWGFAYDFPFSVVVAVCLLIGVVISREPKRMPWSSVTVVWIFFFLWTALTTLLALVPDQAAEEWSRWWKINLISLIVLLVMRSRQRLDMLIWVMALSLGFYGVKGGIFAIMTGGKYMVMGPPGSFFGGNTGVALALIMSLPLMRYLQLEAKNVWVNRGLIAAMGLTFLAILASQSRGAFLGLAGAAAIIVIKSRNWFRIGLLLALAAVAALSFMPDKWFDRMETIQTYEEDESAMGRINAWWFAYNLAADRPLIGGGFRVFTPKLFLKYAPDPEVFHDSHSIYFEVLGEQGFVGLTLFLLLAFLTFRSASWIIRSTRDRPNLRWANHLAAMLQVSLVGYAIGGAFLGLAYFDFYYSLVALIVLTGKIVERELAAEAEEATATLSADVAVYEGNNRGLSW